LYRYQGQLAEPDPAPRPAFRGSLLAGKFNHIAEGPSTSMSAKKRALIVGINHYASISRLHGCVDDARRVAGVLSRHGNRAGMPNYACNVITAEDQFKTCTGERLRSEIQELFAHPGDAALLYFAGHGRVEETGGYLLGSDAKANDTRVALHDIVTMANQSPVKNRVIVLDSCHSGVAGNLPLGDKPVVLTEGMTILTAATEKQYATEESGSGLFTGLLVDALEGGAANLIGQITAASVYAHIDQSLGGWEQRPVFKTNVQSFEPLREVEPLIEPSELRLLTEFFPKDDLLFDLDPSFEPRDEGRTDAMPRANPVNVKRFESLQRYNRLGLLVPHDAPHMWHAAMESKACKLTPLGRHYHRLVRKGQI
jgi:hypothetical protein